MNYYNKYLKYKNKYLNLLAGGKDTYDLDLNSYINCETTKRDCVQKEYGYCENEKKKCLFGNKDKNTISTEHYLKCENKKLRCIDKKYKPCELQKQDCLFKRHLSN